MYETQPFVPRKFRGIKLMEKNGPQRDNHSGGGGGGGGWGVGRGGLAFGGGVREILKKHFRDEAGMEGRSAFLGRIRGKAPRRKNTG